MATTSRPQTILVVEDNEEFLDFLTQFLKQHDYKCIEAKSAEDALTKFKTTKFIDVVISDVWLYERPGLDLLREIKVLKPKQPFILMSGDSMMSRAQAIAAGATEFLMKPFETRELLAAVKAVLA
jgi:DNA-binding response OmpR family regulator